jgi:hypothetical protein
MTDIEKKAKFAVDDNMKPEYLAGHMESNALALEYKRDYGTASRDLDVFDLVNNPCANGVCSIFGLGFSKEGADSLLSDIGAFCDDRANPLLVAQDSAQMLP